MEAQRSYEELINNDAINSAKSGMQFAVDKQPDAEARLQTLAKQYNLPVDAVRLDPKAIERKSQLDAVDYESLVKTAPHTNYLLSDPNKAAVAHDDIPNLSQIEGGLKALRSPEPNALNIASGLLSNLSFSPLHSAIKVAFHDAFFDDGTATAQLRHNDLLRKSLQQKDALDNTTPDFETDTARGIYSGAASFMQALPGMAASVATANPLPMIASAGVQQGFPAYGKYLDRGATKAEAALGAVGEGTAEMGFEAMPMGFIVKKFGKVGAGEFLTGLFAREIPSEQATTIAQDAIDTAIANPDKSWGDFVNERPDAAYQTLLATVTQGGITGAISSIAKRMTDQGKHVDSANLGAINIEKLNQLAAASKVLARSPDTIKTFAEAALAGSPVQDLYIDAQTFLQSGVAEHVAALLPDVAEQLKEALPGTEIRIPISDYLTHIAATDYAATLKDHLRLEGDDYSPAQAQSYMQTHAQEMQHEIDSILTSHQQADTFRTSQDTVKATVLEQLNKLNRFSSTKNELDATLISARMAVRAAQLGITPEQMYEKQTPNFAAESVGGGMVYGQEKPIKTTLTKAQKEKLDTEYFAAIAEGDLNKAQALVNIAANRSGYGQDNYKLSHTAPGRDQYPITNLSEIYPADIYSSKATQYYGDGWSYDSEAMRKLQRVKDKPKSSFIVYRAVPKDIKEGSPRNGDWVATTKQYAKQHGDAQFPEGYRIIEVAVLAKNLFTDGNSIHELGFDDGKEYAYQNTKNNRKSIDTITYDDEGNAVPLSKRFNAKSDEVFNQTDNTTTPEQLAEAERQYREVEAQWFSEDGTEKLGAMLAPNGESTKLNKSQWIQVRTPNFKRWFGNWEFDGNKEVAVIAAEKIPENVDYKDAKSIRDWLLSADNLNDPVKNKETGLGIIFSNVNLKASLKRRGEDHTYAYTVLEKLIAEASFFNFEPSNRPKLAGQDVYYAALSINDQTYTVKIKTDVRHDRSIAYKDHKITQLADIKDIEVTPAVYADGTKALGYLSEDSPPRSGAPIRLSHLTANVNPKSSSVVDENGEPLVVYHGTPDADFEVFKPDSYFTADKDYADVYQNTNASSISSKPKKGNTPDTLPIFLNIRKPFDTRNANIKKVFYDEFFMKWGNGSELSDKGLPDWVEALDLSEWIEEEEKDYDGLLLDEGGTPSENGDTKTRGISYVNLSENQVKSATENNGDFDGNDANILHQQQYGSFHPPTNTIAIFKQGNLSTVLHELGHFFFENDIALAAELFTKPELTAGEQQIVSDVSALLSWSGIQGTLQEQLDQWYSMDIEEKRGAHERTAEAFEAYLFSSTAPSIELQHAFQTFRTWLISVYKSLKDFLATHPEAGKLNEEVSAIFDRMLATEEEIKLAEKARSLMPLFESAKKAGMSEADFAAYQALGVEATNTAIDALQAKALGDMEWMGRAHTQYLKALQKKHDELRREVRSQARTDIMAQPVYRAYSFLTGKLNQDDSQEVGRFGLPLLKDMGLPDAAVNLMINLKMTAKDGLHPDIVSDLFGFSSGDELVNALASAENPKAAIEHLTDQRMLQEHGELATPEAVEEAADRAVHNKFRERLLRSEANTLAKATGSLRLLGNAAKEYTQAMIGRLKVRDIKPINYSRAEVKAARAAEQAHRKGDTEQAATEKRNQVLNMQAFRAAVAAQEEIDAGLRKVKQLNASAAQGNMRGDFLAQLNTLLARFDFRTSLSLKEIDQHKAPLADWIISESERLDAVVPELPDFMLNENIRKHYKDFTVDEFRAFMAGIKQLEFMARREQKQYMEIRQQNFEQERDAVLAVLKENYPEAFDAEGQVLRLEPDFVPTLSKTLSSMADGFIGEFLNAENIIDLLERGKMGQVFDSLFGRISHRSDWKAERLTGIYQTLKPLFKAYGLKEGRDFSRKGIPIDAIKTSITRENAVMVALLNGNAEGKDRLSNYGWNEYAVNAITSQLTPKDIDLIEGIWALFDHSLWPELKELNERTRGQAPPKVEAVPYMINGRQVTGGYMRLKYDTKLDERSKRLDEGQAVKDLLGGGLGMTSKTNQGTSNQRVQDVKLRPRLDLGVMSEAIAETVHDIAYREAIADTMRMLNDRAIGNAVKLAQGTPAYDALVTRVREVAAPPRNPAGWIEKPMSVARKNTVIAMMSGVTTALQNFTGIAPAIGKSLFTFETRGLMLREITQFYSPKMNERIQFALESSAYMRGRFGNFDRDLSDMTRQLTVNGSIMPSDATFLWLMSAVDRAVAVPIWCASFGEGMQKFNNDSDQATDYADRFVRQTQGSGRDVDLSQIMAGHGPWGQLKKVFTMFYSYFNAQLGLLVTVGAVSKQEAKTNPSLAAAKFTAQFIAIVVVPTVLTELLMHGPGDDDEPEEMARHWAKVFLRYGGSFFPLARDVLATSLSIYAPDGRYVSGFKLSPIESAVETAIKVPAALVDIFSGEGKDSDTRTAIMGIGVMARLPGKLISDTVRGTKAWLAGDAGPQAVILGPPKKH